MAGRMRFFRKDEVHHHMPKAFRAVSVLLFLYAAFSLIILILHEAEFEKPGLLTEKGDVFLIILCICNGFFMLRPGSTITVIPPYMAIPAMAGFTLVCLLIPISPVIPIILAALALIAWGACTGASALAAMQIMLSAYSWCTLGFAWSYPAELGVMLMIAIFLLVFGKRSGRIRIQQKPVSVPGPAQPVKKGILAAGVLLLVIAAFFVLCMIVLLLSGWMRGTNPEDALSFVLPAAGFAMSGVYTLKKSRRGWFAGVILSAAAIILIIMLWREDGFIFHYALLIPALAAAMVLIIFCTGSFLKKE